MGEFESVDTETAVTHVSFRDRKTAERAYYSLHGKELGGVDGTLELSWVSSQPSVPKNAPVAAAAGESGGDINNEMEDGEVEGSEEGEMQDDRQDERGMDMDYDAW